MTSRTVITESAPNQDPLRRLQQRIERAQHPSVDPAPTGPQREDDGDPLATLRRRIDEASDPDELREPAGRAAPPPLSDLLEAFDHARALLRTPIGSVREVDAGEDPVETMDRQIAREADEIGRRRAIDLPRETAPAPTDGPESAAVPSGDGTSAVGREVLRMLADRDLPGGARAEAVRRLAAALESDDREDIRDVLRLLIQA